MQPIPNMLESALWYADMGLQVFPCKTRAKKPLTQNGFKDATTDESQINKWWAMWPDANLAVATGAVSGIFVLDIDKKHAGFQSLAKLEKKHGTLPETWTVKTGGGGLHVYFRHPGGSIRNSSGQLGEGLDIRGDGGYVLVPPSNHESGSDYSWGNEPGDLAAAPTWLLELVKVRESRTPKKSSKGLVPHGKQHDFMVSEAGKLRRIGYDAEQIFQNLWFLLETRCESNPEATEETIRTIANSAETSWDPAGKEYNQTDMGNAERFAEMFEDKARYCVLWKKWLIWNGKRWKKDDDLAVQELAKKSVTRIKKEAIGIKDNLDKQKAYFQWFFKSQDTARLGALVKQARSLLNINPDQLDTDPWLLNVSNGTIDLRTGELGKHDRSHYITKLAPYSYGDAKCPLFLKFLGEILEHKVEVIEFVQKFFGHCLTGDTSERIFMLFHGGGMNGKSTLLALIQKMMGDYSMSVTAETLLKREKGTIRNDIAKLKGARFVSAKEAEENKYLNAAIVKELTGNEEMTARFLHAEEFDFMPSCKICLGTNHLPKISADDQAAWDRVRRVKFNVRMKTKEDPSGTIEIDKSLPEKLRGELDGILTWCVQGCLAWQREGLGTPQSVMAATEEYRDDEDIISAFIEQCCVLGEDEEENTNCLYQSYKYWCMENGHRPLGSQNLKKRMEVKGYRHEKRKDGNKWISLSLVPEAIIRDR